MTNYRSNEYWKSSTNYRPFELRSHRFRDDMLPVFYKWLDIHGNSIILDAGCGSGVFTRFLAKGLTTGHITGFDISDAFIEYGNEKIIELCLNKNVNLEIADGYNLHYPDNHFDAVTNYTYIGVLADMKAGLEELIRVCKKSGTVSCVVATNNIPNIGYQGNYPFEGAMRLQQLATLEWKIHCGNAIQGPMTQLAELELMVECGLKDIHIYPFAHLMCYNDTNLPSEYRKTLAMDETADEIRWLKSRYSEKEKSYTEQGFSSKDFAELVALLERKLDYLTHHFDSDNSYEWHGGFNFIVTGQKYSNPT